MIDYTNRVTGNHRSTVVVWAGMAANDVGQPTSNCQYTDKSVQVSGTFGGAALLLEGSNNGTDWAVLTDPQGNPLTFTAAKIEMVTEATLYVRPRVSGGDGTTALTVDLLLKE